MRAQTWGARGEHSLKVRRACEDVIGGVWPKDYLGEVLAIRNFATDHIRYTNDPRHIELIKDPERIIAEIEERGVCLCDCDEIAQLIATMALVAGRTAEFVVVGFGAAGDYSHVFARVQEPKSGIQVVCDPVAGQDERQMLERVTTKQFWSLDDTDEPASVKGWPPMLGIPSQLPGMPPQLLGYHRTAMKNFPVRYA